MISYLIQRPIAVITATCSLLLLGMVSLFNIPVSLMPDIDIPEISIRIEAQDLISRELENGIVKPLKRSLTQTTHLDKIHTETTSGGSTIYLKFDYGTDIDFAYIEVNEKLDQALINFPREIERPRVIKASASDIPVFFLDISYKDDLQGFALNHNSTRILELSKFSREVLRKRIEQLPGVALADISGLLQPQINILPNQAKIDALGITLKDIEEAIRQHNRDLENLTIRDNQFAYHVRLSNLLTDQKSLNEITITKGERLFKLRDLATITEQPQPRTGMVLNDDKEAISIAIIKQSDARISAVKSQLNLLIDDLREIYPGIQFEIIKDQSKLLDVSIQQLLQSFLWGITLAFIIMFFFLKNFRAPLLIGVSIPVSLIISMLLFHQFGMSINIISLSGLILGVGLMVDNTIIVIDNITQHRQKAVPLAKACALGAVEVFRPLLSSALTTCAVFIPLIFLSGISGALFFDQAMAISIGLFSSLLVSICLIPVLYRLFHQKIQQKPTITPQRKALPNLGYHQGVKWVLRHQWLSWMMFLLLPAGAFWLYIILEKKQLPELTKTEQIISIDWSESINLEENRARVIDMMQSLQTTPLTSQSLLGDQQFLTQKNGPEGAEQSLIYIEAKTAPDLAAIREQITKYLQTHYPASQSNWQDTKNIFTLIFPESLPDLTVKLYWGEINDQHKKTVINEVTELLHNKIPNLEIPTIPWKESIMLEINFEQLVLYQIDARQLYDAVQQAFNQHKVTTLSGNGVFLPVILGTDIPKVHQALNTANVQSSDSIYYPVRTFFTEKIIQEQKVIHSDHLGDYHALNFELNTDDIPDALGAIKATLNNSSEFIAGYSGNYFESQHLIKELVLVLLVSILLLYFILAAQFESFTMPFIILLEIPMDIAGSFLLLYLLGQGINLMSMIGIIVMSGIIINDSILKIDTINQLRRQGHSLTRSILEAGEKRLKPILMTSITTILALTPLLFTSGLGSELQRPLAVAVIGGISLGTIISLYFIPLCYYQLCKKS